MNPVSPLEALAAAIARLSRASSRAELPAASGKVGSMLMRAADDVPGMFERGRSFADSADGLAEQFGTGQLKSPGMDYTGNDSYAYSIPAEEGLPHFRQDYPQLLGSVDRAVNMSKQQPMLPPIGDLFKSGLMRDDKQYHVWDTSSLDPGSSQGTRLYPAAFGHLRNLGPEHVNVSEGLSTSNQLRRSYLQASALERDPSLADQVLISPSQLVRGGLELTPREFHRFSPEQQIGALQIAGARGALESMRDAITGDMSRIRSGSKSEPSTRAQRQRHLDATNFIMPKFMDQPYSPELTRATANAYQLSPMSVLAPLGNRSLTKLGLVQDILKGASFEDLASRFPGLEYRTGGSV